MSEEIDWALTTSPPYAPQAPKNQWLREALGHTPFPWQKELYTRFANGTIERSLDIPTGLGKTGVMAIWLVARAHGATLPRRLTYVVDRRAVVDQATDVAEGLRACVDGNPLLKHALGLENRSLPISTLRGQHVDNREWLEDPASPAIIVGTVDMIGSRLLFEGYGTSRKMRPYQAGLLGADALVVIDEAHLVPPFEKLLETISEGDAMFSPRDETLRRLVPPFKLLALSATGRAYTGKKPFGLQDADLQDPVVRRRLDAPKHLTIHSIDGQTKLEDALAGQAWKLTDHGRRSARIIVFCDKREVAVATKAAIEKRAKDEEKPGRPAVEIDTELFVGGRRVFEREAVAGRLRDLGFMAGTAVERGRPAFVFATSAGEVGVDLDADHMVSDLVAWERMVQRLGRVNRRGEGKAQVITIAEPPSTEVEKARQKAGEDRSASELMSVALAERKDAVRQLVDRLPAKGDARDASPGALRTLKLSATSDAETSRLLEVATTPAPLRPALSRALVDAWSLTSLAEHTGRPEIDPWLRGWVDDDPPHTTVVWRTHLPVRPDGITTRREIEAFFEAAPPHASESLETETFRVVAWLTDCAKDWAAAVNGRTMNSPRSGENGERAPLRRDDAAAVVLTPAGDWRATLRLADLAPTDDKDATRKRKESLERDLAAATLVVDARIGGLHDGLLLSKVAKPPRTIDDGRLWISAGAANSGGASLAAPVPTVRFRVRTAESGQPSVIDTQWRERFRFATELSEDGEPSRWLIIEKWRHDAATEDDRSAGRPQLLSQHQAWAEQRARDLARRLGLPDAYVDMLATAACLHDEGKRSRSWQRAFNAQSDGVYAKTRGPVNIALLGSYRHEFGSLPIAAKAPRFRDLSEELQDLALHLIAAHHGFARPTIGITGCEDAPPSALEERARKVALRFARLQKRWGPWALAWWESLLRAVDQQASRDNDAADSASTTASV